MLLVILGEYFGYLEFRLVMIDGLQLHFVFSQLLFSQHSLDERVGASCVDGLLTLIHYGRLS
jgi:hypothetical protein